MVCLRDEGANNKGATISKEGGAGPMGEKEREEVHQTHRAARHRAASKENTLQPAHLGSLNAMLRGANT